MLIGATACQAKEKLIIKTPSGDREAFYVDLAVTQEEQSKGLMFVEDMPKDEGMLFIYPAPGPASFWMKNTLIPLDMLFFDDTNTLIHIEHSAVPHDESPRGPGNELVCSILELNGGTAKQNGIEVGAKLLGDFTQECLQSSIN